MRNYINKPIPHNCLISEMYSMGMLRDTVVNLSDTQFSDEQLKVLSHGPKFVTSQYTRPNLAIIKRDLQKLKYRIRKLYRSWSHNQYRPSFNQQKTVYRLYRSIQHKGMIDITLSGNTSLEQTLSQLDAHVNSLFHKHGKRPGPMSHTSTVLSEIMILKNKNRLVFKRADKGGALVIMTAEQYHSKVLNHLQDKTTYYHLGSTDPTYRMSENIAHFLQRLEREGSIDSNTLSLLTPVANKTRTGLFYILPKIHKPDIPGRPIVSSCNSHTERLSAFVDEALKPLRKLIKSHVRDTQDFLEKIQNVKIKEKSLLVTLDVSALYTNIEARRGIEAIRSFVTKHNRIYTGPPIQALIDSIHMILSTNYFMFDNQFYLQISGTAMGTRFAPSYADIYMAEVEEHYISTQEYQPSLFLRFLDDIFLIWHHGNESLQLFINGLNNIHTRLRFTASISPTNIAFLDLNVYTENGKLKSDLYVKPTDVHNILPFNSHHNPDTKWGIIKAQSIRYLRIISDPNILLLRLYNMYLLFCAKGYPQRKTLTLIAETYKQSMQIQSKRKKREFTQGQALMITPYHPSIKPTFKHLFETVLKPHFNTHMQLHKVEVSTVFSRDKNLGDHLIQTRDVG